MWEYQAPGMRTLQGVKIFASGTWTDSEGNERKWTEKDLEDMVANFHAGYPQNTPLKAGHTTDIFNSEIANALGIPVALITGEIGQGQIGLGRLTSLERRGEYLLGSFEGVPNTIADLVDNGMYSSVSAEIELIENIGPTLTGVALLGAENPAVENATLERVNVFSERPNTSVYTIMPDSTQGGVMNRLEQIAHALGIRGDKQTTQEDNMELQEMEKQIADFQEKEAEFKSSLAKIAEAMGLSEGASIDDVLAKIKGKKHSEPDQFEAMQAAFEERIAALENQNSELEGSLAHKRKAGEYAQYTKLLDTVEGTPEDLAERLADIDDKAGPEVASQMYNAWHKANEANKQAFTVMGTSQRQDAPAGHPFEDEIKKYAETNGVTENQALARMATDPKHQAQYREYRRAMRVN